MVCKTILTKDFLEIIFARPKKRAKIDLSILLVCITSRRLEQLEKK
jgi:hypothetical protein